MFTYQTQIKLHDTDAAGLLFFSNQLKLAHDAYEAFLGTLGIPFSELIKKTPFCLPIVHNEPDSKLPLFVGDLIEIQVTVSNVGKTSFTLAYTLLNPTQDLVGTAQTVHVAIDKATRKKIPIPQELRSKLENARG